MVMFTHKPTLGPIKPVAHVFCAAEGCSNQCSVKAPAAQLNAVWHAHPWWREEVGGHVCGRCWHELKAQEEAQ